MEQKATQKLGRYDLTGALSNKDAGSCRWCFATHDGQECFIKEFLEPKHPETDTTSSPEKREKKLNKCREFEYLKTKVYQAVNACSDGNLTRITEFFRVGAKYYMVMPKIKSLRLEISEIANFPAHVSRRLCAIIAHAIARLHSVHFVHADIKHTNILFVRSKSNKMTAKIIDYDAGFFEDNPPTDPEAIAGDENYFSPEAYRAWREEGLCLTCKMDIFAMGVLFHQYLTGKFPGFDAEEFSSVGEAVSFGETAVVSDDLSEDMHNLICSMLESDPNMRPTAQEVFHVLSSTGIVTYTVRHEIDGKPRDVFTYGNETATDGKIAVFSSSLSEKPYSGYKIDRILPSVKAGDLIADHTVITLQYVKDMSQTKTVSYRVVHKSEETILDATSQIKDVWINDPDEIILEAKSLTPKEFAGYQFQSIVPVVQPYDNVPSGTEITLNYKKVTIAAPHITEPETNNGDQLGRGGFRPMDRL